MPKPASEHVSAPSAVGCGCSTHSATALVRRSTVATAHLSRTPSIPSADTVRDAYSTRPSDASPT
eukprot:scaffold2976_cov104-Isochrysis_galbana.AAC.1